MRIGVVAMIGACGFNLHTSDRVPDARDVDAPDVDAPRCPSTYAPLGAASTSVYRVSGGPMGADNTGRSTWVGAEADCADDGWTTHLAIPETMAEHQMFVDVLSGASRWLGVTDRKTEGTWLTITGGTTFWTYWTQMPMQGSNDCLLLTRVPSHEDTPCNVPGAINEYLKGYICECDGKPLDPTAF